MTTYEEDQIAFSVLSLVRDPLKDYTEQLARNVRGLQSIRQRLNESQLEDIEAVLGTDGFGGALLDADPALGLTEECLMAVEAPGSGNGIHDNDLPQEYVRLASSQQDIKTSILVEIQSRRDEEASVEVRRHDCSSAVEFWARALASKGVVQDILLSTDEKN
jgi:ubiquitin carboxyl-terminal hydrolase L5